MPLDKVLYQVAKIKHDSGEPDKIWEITDIDDLIASTDADSTALDYDDDDELLMSIAYYKNRYSDDDISSEYETIYTDPKEPESEPDEEPEPEEAEPENPADEPEASAEAETEEPAEPAESDETEQTVENKEPVSEVSFAKPESTSFTRAPPSAIQYCIQPPFSKTQKEYGSPAAMRNPCPADRDTPLYAPFPLKRKCSTVRFDSTLST